MPYIKMQNNDIHENSNLTKHQLLMWIGQKIYPQVSLYNAPFTFTITGLIDRESLQTAFQTLINQSDVLRTVFQEIDGIPQQIVIPNMVYNMEYLDCSSVSAPFATAQTWISEHAQVPFDLGERLFESVLLKVSDNQFVWYLNTHHIISDTGTVALIFQWVATFYNQAIHGQLENHATLPMFQDYVNYRRKWHRTEQYLAAEAYWKKKLAVGIEPINFYGIIPFNNGTDVRRVSYDLGTVRTQQLKKMATNKDIFLKTENATLFNIFLTTLFTYLYRLSGNTCLSIAAPFHNRHSTFKQTLGLQMEIYPFRVSIEENDTFFSLLKKVAVETSATLKHRNYTAGNPLQNRAYDVRLNYHVASFPDFNGLPVQTEFVSAGHSTDSLVIHVHDFCATGKLTLMFDFHCDVFDSEKKQHLAIQHFIRILDALVEAPDTQLYSFSLLTSESRALLPDPSAVLPVPCYDLVTDLFTLWVNRTPTHPAIRQKQRSWTYQELAKSAHLLTQVLLTYGIKRGDVVAVLGLRSFGLIASMLGVFSSGGVLLTLDPKLPNQRRQLMLKEAKAKYLLLVGEKIFREEWMGQSLFIIGVHPETGHTLTKVENEQPLPNLAANDPAYIFFTSGTTGVPKGVLGCHKGMSHFLNWQRQTFAIKPQDRCAQLTGLSFDVLIRDIFLALTSGATLCLPANGDELEPAKILSWLAEEQISLFHTVPSLVQSWLAFVPPGVSLSTLRYVFFAGEPLTEKLICQWREAFPHAGEIVNLYGPTETTLAKCYYRVPNKVSPGIQPVGSPMPETQALVLTKNNNLCDRGEPGEIVLRTPFRTLGYINAPEEKQFRQNPFRNDEQDLLYYTGDRGRYRMDGSLEILGRIDNQVKIRGMRIELEEIEIVLGKHPSIHKTVITIQVKAETKYLVAYYTVTSSQAESTPSTLRRFLKEKLPNYMVPSAFIKLDAMPLTPNGKVDRRALPIVEISRNGLEEYFVAPRTPTEETLVRIWIEVLKIKSVGIYDNFFELGGNSLLVFQIMSRLSKIFEVKLPLTNFFEGPTIAKLAQRIETIHWATKSLPTTNPDEELEEGEL